MNELFANISINKQEKLLREFESISVKYPKKSNILINEASIILVLKGIIQITKNNSEGEKISFEEYYDNEILVVSNLIAKSEDYEITTKEESQITIIDFNNIINIRLDNTNTYNQFLRNLINIMGNNIAKQNERIEILVNKTIRNKLLTYFKIMYDKNKSHIIYLPSTFTDLADYLAIDRSAMNRELKHLKDEGFIEINNKRIKLLYYV